MRVACIAILAVALLCATRNAAIAKSDYPQCFPFTTTAPATATVCVSPYIDKYTPSTFVRVIVFNKDCTSPLAPHGCRPYSQGAVLRKGSCAHPETVIAPLSDVQFVPDHSNNDIPPYYDGDSSTVVNERLISSSAGSNVIWVTDSKHPSAGIIGCADLTGYGFQ